MIILHLRKSIENARLQVILKTQINKNVARTGDIWSCVFDNFSEMKVENLVRILDIYYTRDTASFEYIQGYHAILYAICYKFLSSGISWTPEIEAKTYYIYSKIIEILRDFEDSSEWMSKFNLYSDKFKKQADASTQQKLKMLYEKDVVAYVIGSRHHDMLWQLTDLIYSLNLKHYCRLF